MLFFNSKKNIHDLDDEMRTAKIEYASLDGSLSSRPPETSWASRSSSFLSSITSFWRELAIVILCIACAFLTLERSMQPLDVQDRPQVPEYTTISDDYRWKQFDWYTDVYSSEDPANDAAVDAAWDAIIPSHGVVAVPHDWANEHELPDTMSLPSDPSKGVYILDSYHQIHCLTVIRKTLMEINAGKTPSKPVKHSRHCFDSLLQYITCGTPGDTLLYTWGQNTTGAGQYRKCVDWQSRKQWAKENTACYVDTDHPVMLIEHFNDCSVAEDDGIKNAGWPTTPPE